MCLFLQVIKKGQVIGLHSFVYSRLVLVGYSSVPTIKTFKKIKLKSSFLNLFYNTVNERKTETDNERRQRKRESEYVRQRKK